MVNGFATKALVFTLNLRSDASAFILEQSGYYVPFTVRVCCSGSVSFVLSLSLAFVTVF